MEKVKYFKYFFGPGAVVASITIGQGQLILGPQIGAWAGYSLLWLISINIASFIIAYIGCRFMLLSGINMMDLFAIKIKKLNWIFMLIVFIFVPLFTAAIVTTLGQSIEWIVGRGNYLIWGISFCLFAAILAIVGRYRIVEYTQAFFVAVLGIGAIASIIVIKPSIADILPNFFKIGSVPNYPEWVYNKYPSIANTPAPLFILGYLGTLTFTIITIVGYSGWIKLKRWGIFKEKEKPEKFSQKLLNIFIKEKRISYLPTNKNEMRKLKILLRPMIIDMAIAFILISLVSAAYMIAGSCLLRPREVLPSDVNLLKEQAIIFSNIAPWLKPLYQISVFFALFGTVYAGFEAVSRMLYETSKGISNRIRNMPYKKFMLYLMLYILSTGLPLAILSYFGIISILLILSITLLFIGVVGVIIYGMGAIYMSQKILPIEYRLGKIGLTLGIISIILLCIPFLLFMNL